MIKKTASASAHARLTPDEQQEAFLSQKRTFKHINVEPMSLAVIWLLEDLRHPFLLGFEPVLDESGNPKRDAGGNIIHKSPTMQEIAVAVFAFHDPIAAREALDKGREVLLSEAHRLAATISPQLLDKITAAIIENLKGYFEELSAKPQTTNRRS